MNNYNPQQALNQQIKDFNIPNVEPIEIIDKPVNEYGDITKIFLPIELGLSNTDQLHKIIVSHVEKTNFLTYINSMGGDDKNYINNGKNRIPKSILAVIVNDYTINLAANLGYSLNQLYSNDSEVKAAYLFNGKYWLSITDSFLKNLLREVLIGMGHDPVESKTATLGDTLIRTFWENAGKAPIKDDERILINLANCTIEIMPDGKIKQLPFNKNDFMLYCLPYDYNNTNTCPLFMKYLNRVLPDKESITILQELLGSIFVKNINLEKIGILYGSGSNGKSVLLKIITTLLGNNNISQMDLKSLTTDKNADNNRYQLMGKLLNFAPEINAKGEQMHDLIKRMASGEAIQVKILYKNTMTITDYAKLIFNANILPSDVEHSHGFFRRFLIIGFDQTITEKEKDLELANKIIATELPAILNWIIEGTKRLQQNKKFSQCKKSDEILERYKLESDVVAMWIEERGYVTHEYLTKLLTELYQELRQFAHNGGYKLPSSKTVADRLRSNGIKQRKGKPAAFYIAENKTIK